VSVDTESYSTSVTGSGSGFLGRIPELQQLGTALDTAAGGSAQVVVIEGDAGLGKTALLRHFIASQQTAAVLEVSGDEEETVLGLGVIGQLARSMPPGVLTARPLLAAGPTESADTFAVGAELLQGLGLLQERGTVMVVVDDMHWADVASAQALLFVMRRLRNDHVLTILSTRPDGLSRLGRSWQRLLADGSLCRWVRLQGLSTEEVRALATSRGRGRLSVTAAERLRSHTGGHPLYLCSILDDLSTETLNAATGPLPVPHSLSATVLSRLASLSGEAQDLVAAAAVVGQRSSLPVVTSVVRIPEPTRALDEAIAAGMIQRVTGPVGDELAFSHPLVRAAVYRDLSPSRRRDLHTAAGKATVGPPALGHRVAAVEVADDDLATELEELAQTELIGGATSAAADHLLWAAEISSDTQSREARLLAAVGAMVFARDEARARSFTGALEDCTDAARCSYIRGSLDFLSGHLDEAEAQFRRAFAAAERSGATTPASEAAASLAMLALNRGNGPAGVSWARRAVELPSTDPTVAARARGILAMGLAMTGDAPGALNLLGPLNDDAALPTRYDAEFLAIRGQIRVWSNDLVGAIKDLSAVVRWARSGRTVLRFSTVYGNLADAEYQMGLWDAAQVHTDLAVSLAEDLDAGWELPFVHAVASWVYAGRGAWELATGHVAECRRATERSPSIGGTIYACMAEASLSRARGDHQGVLNALSPILEGPERDLVEELGVVRWRVLYAEALVGLGQLQQADAAVTRLEEIASARHLASIEVDACRLRGSLEAVMGNDAAARAAFSQGLTVLERTVMPFGRALLEATFGQFLLGSRDRRAAIDHLRRSQEILRALDARPYLAFCEAELSKCGLSRTTKSPESAFELTAKERAVAHLAGEGMTNREIAAELYVSAKSVEYHLRNVFAKFGITSRRQLRPALSSASL
jgi:ATP/maltotriose-dependent transcriptional regulator MalT